MTLLNNRCIIVAEDEFYLAKDLTKTLKTAGARILGPFPRTEPALAALATGAADCAVIDVNLGGGASFVLADALRAQGVPFLFFTGYDREVIPQRFAQVVRLEKPVDTGRLVRAVEATCGSTCDAPNPG